MNDKNLLQTLFTGFLIASIIFILQGFFEIIQSSFENFFSEIAGQFIFIVFTLFLIFIILGSLSKFPHLLNLRDKELIKMIKKGTYWAIGLFIFCILFLGFVMLKRYKELYPMGEIIPLLKSFSYI